MKWTTLSLFLILFLSLYSASAGGWNDARSYYWDIEVGDCLPINVAGQHPDYAVVYSPSDSTSFDAYDLCIKGNFFSRLVHWFKGFFDWLIPSASAVSTFEYCTSGYNSGTNSHYSTCRIEKANYTTCLGLVNCTAVYDGDSVTNTTSNDTYADLFTEFDFSSYGSEDTVTSLAYKLWWDFNASSSDLSFYCLNSSHHWHKFALQNNTFYLCEYDDDDHEYDCTDNAASAFSSTLSPSTSCLVDSNLTINVTCSSCYGNLTFKEHQSWASFTDQGGQSLPSDPLEELTAGGTLVDVLKSWNPEVYPLLEAGVKEWLFAPDLKNFGPNTFKVFSLLVKYVLREPGSLGGSYEN